MVHHIQAKRVLGNEARVLALFPVVLQGMFLSSIPLLCIAIFRDSMNASVLSLCAVVER